MCAPDASIHDVSGIHDVLSQCSLLHPLDIGMIGTAAGHQADISVATPSLVCFFVIVCHPAYVLEF